MYFFFSSFLTAKNIGAEQTFLNDWIYIDNAEKKKTKWKNTDEKKFRRKNERKVMKKIHLHSPQKKNIVKEKREKKKEKLRKKNIMNVLDTF